MCLKISIDGEKTKTSCNRLRKNQVENAKYNSQNKTQDK